VEGPAELANARFAETFATTEPPPRVLTKLRRSVVGTTSHKPRRLEMRSGGVALL